MSLGMNVSSVAAFKGSDHLPRDKKLLFTLIIITLLTSAVGPFFLPYISIDVFKSILAVMTLASIPLLFINRKSIHINSRDRTVGLVLFGLVLLANSFIASSIFSILIAVVLAQMFHLTILQSTVLRRILGLVQYIVIFSILVTLGGFVWQHALAAIAGGSIGSYFGTKFAIKKGEKFAKYALAVGGCVSCLLMLVS